MLKKIIASALILSSIAGNIPCFGQDILSHESNAQNIKHIYINEGVENVVLLSKKYDFKKEAEQFRDFRNKYAWFWTGIIAGLVYYSYARTHK